MAKDTSALEVFSGLSEEQKVALFAEMADNLRDSGLASVVKSAANKFDASEHIIGEEVWKSPIAELIENVRNSVQVRSHVSGNYNTETGQPQVRVFVEVISKEAIEAACTELGDALANEDAEDSVKVAVKALGSRWVTTGPAIKLASDEPMVVYGDVTPKKLEITGPTIYTQQRKRATENGEPTPPTNQ